MEEPIVTAPEPPEAPEVPASPEEAPLTRQEVEAHLSRLAGRLTRQMEAVAQAAAARREELDARETALRQRELTARAREEMEKRGLPAALAEALPFQAEESLARGLDALESAFRAAVQQGVEARLLTDAPKKSAVRPLNELPDEDYYAAVCCRDI